MTEKITISGSIQQSIDCTENFDKLSEQAMNQILEKGVTVVLTDQKGNTVCKDFVNKIEAPVIVECIKEIKKEDTQLQHCDRCNVDVKAYHFKRHTKTKGHLGKPKSIEDRLDHIQLQLEEQNNILRGLWKETIKASVKKIK